MLILKVQKSPLMQSRHIVSESHIAEFSHTVTGKREPESQRNQNKFSSQSRVKIK